MADARALLVLDNFEQVSRWARAMAAMWLSCVGGWTASRWRSSSLRLGLPGAEPRFRMLEIVSEYARERLESRGEADSTERRFADNYIRFAQTAGRGLLTAEHSRWLETIDAEIDNARAVVNRAVARRDFATALRFGTPLWIYSFLRSWTSFTRRRSSRQAAGSDHILALMFDHLGVDALARGRCGGAWPVRAGRLPRPPYA